MSNVAPLIAAVRFGEKCLLAVMDEVWVLTYKLKRRLWTLDVLKSVAKLKGEILIPISAFFWPVTQTLEWISLVLFRQIETGWKVLLKMMLDATQDYQTPWTDERLFGWHAASYSYRSKGCKKLP